jgi:DNA-binding response OmpR family regulator
LIFEGFTPSPPFMPDMDGISAIARILEEDRKPRIIVHTAYPEYRENFMTWGADAYIMKSLDLKELKEKVRELLEQINPL